MDDFQEQVSDARALLDREAVEVAPEAGVPQLVEIQILVPETARSLRPLNAGIFLVWLSVAASSGQSVGLAVA
jgi:hypothetical protein